jgi:hypothetical protein
MMLQGTGMASYAVLVCEDGSAAIGITVPVSQPGDSSQD